MNVIDYELTCDISHLFGKKIFIYGTGFYGNKVTTVLLQMKIKIDGFCETIPRRSEYLGKAIISVERLIEDYDKNDVLIIIASEKYYKEMIKEIQNTKHMFVCTYYALFVSLYLNDEADEIIDAFKENIKFFKNASLDIAVRDLLECRMVSYYEILSKPLSVWLYQPGKVGSVTIYKSNLLKNHHFHSLAYAYNDCGDVTDICRNVIDIFKKNTIKIITGVREPISRDLSVMFQTTDIGIWPLIRWGSSSLYLFGDYSQKSQLDIQTLKKRICVWEKSLNNCFNHISKEIAENKADEFSWFDYEIKALLGVDIYAYPFDKEKGYTIIEQDNICILVYKCEKLNQLENVIGAFLENPEFTLKNANQGEEKIYSYVYKRFKEEVKLNKEYFEYYYTDNPKLKHFYTNAEIEQFKQKWEKKLQ